MLCQKCGTDNEGNAKFCTGCGAPLYQEASSQKSNAYENNSGSIMRNANGNISGYYYSQNQGTTQNGAGKKKKLGKPVVALIIVISVFAACAVGAAVVKQAKLKKAEEAINAVEMPEIPDFDIDTDFGSDYDGEQSEFGYGVIENGVYRNDSIDLSLKPYNSDWKILSKDEIHQYYFDLDIDVSFDEETKETYMQDGSYKLYYDAVMSHTDGSMLEVCLYELNDGVSATLNDVFTASDEAIKEEAEKFSESSGKTTEKTPMESAGFMEINSNSYSVKKTALKVDGKTISTCYFAGSKIGNKLIIMTLIDKSNSINFLDFFERITKQ